MADKILFINKSDEKVHITTYDSHGGTPDFHEIPPKPTWDPGSNPNPKNSWEKEVTKKAFFCLKTDTPHSFNIESEPEAELVPFQFNENGNGEKVFVFTFRDNNKASDPGGLNRIDIRIIQPPVLHPAT